ncbi:MAG: tRNA pseudouridine(38-40) synthase TruA, partial [Vicinamibacterales bacterium]
VGWQRQPAGTSVQGVVADALAVLDGRQVSAMGASRTDAGVHALGQVAGVTLERDIDGPALVRALNARLPAAVRVIEAIDVPHTFHARFDASAKTYRYRIWNHEVLDPFERFGVWHVPAPRLDLDAMDTAARLFEGRHDFVAFQATGAVTTSTERSVFSSRVRNVPARLGGPRDVVEYEVRGDGFLRHMVRTMVGTLIEVGRGRQEAAWISRVIAEKERANAGRTAPACGLFLVAVHYE